MAGLADLLLSMSQTPSANATVPPASSTSNDVDGITVAPSKRTPVTPPISLQGIQGVQGPITPPNSMSGPVAPSGAPQIDPGPSLNYDNSSSVDAVHKALGLNPPQGGSDNPGIYGLLPQNLQHGTLRNVLGALGDSFLVASGHPATYEPRMQRQEVGDAMAGYDQNPQAAIQRIAATGAPGAAEMASKLEEQRQMMEYNQQYRQQMMASRNEGIYQRGQPVAMGIASQATSPQDYAAKYSMLDARAKAIDPSMTASQAFGIPEPEAWQPGMFKGYGMTSNQQQVASDKGAERGVQVSNNSANNVSRVQAARIAAGGHVQAAGISADRPSEAGTLDDLQTKQDSGQALTPAEQQRWDRGTHISNGRTGRSLPAGLTVGGSNPPIQPAPLTGAAIQGQSRSGFSVQPFGQNNLVANGGKPLTAQQSHQLQKQGTGIHYLGTDGAWHIT